jgi:CRISPR-associated endonuclease Csn1
VPRDRRYRSRLLQRFAQASASAREKQLENLVDSMPLPWPTYYDHVKRAVHNIWVSHKPDHGYEGALMEATARNSQKDGTIKQKSKADGSEGREIKN